LQWAFKWNSALGMAETWHSKGQTPQVNDTVSISDYATSNDNDDS